VYDKCLDVALGANASAIPGRASPTDAQAASGPESWSCCCYGAAVSLSKVCGSFAETTPVTTSEGLKPIGELKNGDAVLARNEMTGAYAFEPVTQVYRHQDPVKVRLTLEDPATGAAEVVETTPEHSFYVPGLGFVEAAALTPGDHVSRAPSAEPPSVSIVRLINLNDTSDALRVKALSLEYQPFWAYNLEVADYHTFFVGADRAWVHNPKCNLNSNEAVSEFGVYEIEVEGEVLLGKVGKADLERVTTLSGLPTRLHQQVRKLEKNSAWVK
jgi:hypothetical protein